MDRHKINTYLLCLPMIAGVTAGLGSMVMENIVSETNRHCFSIIGSKMKIECAF
jgi:hypothetical protein